MVKKAKKTTKKPRKQARKKPAGNLRRKIISAMLDLSARHGWRSVTMKAIAEEASCSGTELQALFPTKQAILNAFLDDVDKNVQAGTKPHEFTESPQESPRDRLFDVLMRRFDILQPHKKAIANIVHDMPSDPLACVCGIPRFGKSMAVMLEAAHLSSPGCTGILKTKGLALVYLNTARTWLRDDTPDMSKTMATLDKSLRRADSVAAAIFKR